MKFKPGDKAKIVGNSNGHGFEIGQEVEVGLLEQSLYRDIYNVGEYFVNDCDLEPLEASPVQEEESPWISVDDRLPDDHQQILFYTTGYSNNSIQKGVFERVDAFGRDEIFCGEGMFQLGNVSHWMPLPKPPISRLKSEIEELKRNKEAS